MFTHIFSITVPYLLHRFLFTAVIPDTRGREFLFAFPSNYGVPETLILQIGGLAVGETRVEVTVPALGFEETLRIVDTNVTAVNIPVTAACVGNGFQNKTVLVRTSRDVNIQAINSRSKSNDGFLVIPTDALGTEYLIPSYTTVGNEKSQFVISAKSDLTQVMIVSGQNLDYGGKIFAAGEKIIFGLQRGQSIQFQSSTDLTGTHITSDKAIAVLSGSTCAVVPEKTSRCDHLVEMIPPVDTWGKRFSLQPLLDRESGFIFRMIAARANTVVKVSGEMVELHRQGQFMEFNQLAKFPLGINANKPILVVQYGKGMQTDGVGDPFMTIIPPIEQYMNGVVTFATFGQSGGGNISSYAGISVTSPSLFTFYLNDVTVLANEPDVSVNGGMFSFGADRAVPLSAGSHVLSNISPDGLFSAIVYGFGIGTAYGFPAGYNLRKLTCSSKDPYTGKVKEFDCPILEEPPEGPKAQAQIAAIPCMPGQPCWPGETPWIPGASRKTWIPLPDLPPSEPLPDGVAGGNIPLNLAPPPPLPIFPGQPEIPPALLPPNQQTCYPVTAIIAAAAAPSIAVFLFMLVLVFTILFSGKPWIPPRLRKS
ncbi:IgGFc-binding protein [Holothuria leucospilota]|uniref:IgGFc-binding protein n=1 Tax=Holothuria leucospilota TaxID=206669 RepID=A0A9Q0YGH8_HOLLE|nr:IgGFc-binding protein [Holothuria leucospilota]